MLTPVIDSTVIALIFSGAVVGFAIFWGIKKAIALL